MSLQQTATLLASSLLFATPAMAQLAVTADLGTTGAGLHLVVPMESNLNGRFGVHGYSRERNKHLSGIDYQVKTTIKNVDILFDWYVLRASPFHLTGGVVHNNNKVGALGRPLADGSYTIDGYTYPAAWVGVLTGELRFRRAAPYLGIGWGNPLTSPGKWSFMGDFGAYYQGGARTRLVGDGCTASAQVCKTVAGSIAVEMGQFREAVRPVRVYPVLRAALAYRF